MPDLPPMSRPPFDERKKKLSASRRGYDREHQEQRADLIRRFPVCQRTGCGQWSEHLHHKDGNPWNRHPSNVEMICLKCHIDEHRRRKPI